MAWWQERRGSLRAGGADELGEIGFLFLQVRQVQIHHVTGGVVVLGDVFQQIGMHAEMVEGVAAGEVGRGHVVEAVRDMDFEERIRGHAFGEDLGDIGELVVGIPVPLPDAGEDVVGAVIFELQIVADVVIEGGGEGTEDGIRAGIGLGALAERIADIVGVAAVEATRNEAFVTQQFCVEAMERDTEV